MELTKTALEKFKDAYIKKTTVQGKFSFPKALGEFSLDELDDLENEVQEVLDGIEEGDPEFSLYNKSFYEDLYRTIPFERKKERK